MFEEFNGDFFTIFGSHCVLPVRERFPEGVNGFPVWAIPLADVDAVVFVEFSCYEVLLFHKYNRFLEQNLRIYHIRFWSFLITSCDYDRSQIFFISNRTEKEDCERKEGTKSYFFWFKMKKKRIEMFMLFEMILKVGMNR